MKALSAILLIAGCCTGGLSQDKIEQYIYPHVDVPDSVYALLTEVCRERDYPDAKGVIIANLDSLKDSSYHDGIYTYGLPGPHFRRRVFIVKNGKAEIFTKQTVAGLLEEFLRFIRRSRLSDSTEVSYLKRIARVLEEDRE